MAIEVNCTCGRKHRVEDRYAGRSVACKACGRPMSVPASSVAVPEPADGGEYELTDDRTPAQSPTVGVGVGTGRMTPYRPVGDTAASNPARLYVQAGQFFRSQWIVFAILAAFLLVLSAASPFITKLQGFWWLPPLLLPVFAWTQLSEMKKKMAIGDVCPAKVIGNAPLKVAVYTDLTTGGGSYPAVYVMKAGELKHAPGGPPAVGTRLAAVSLYSGPPKDGAWQGFSPTLVVSVTRNEADIARVTGSIPADQWAALDHTVAELGDVGPGLYRLDG